MWQTLLWKGCSDNTKKELMAISTNNETDNNNKNIEEDKLEVEHAKELE